MWPFVRPSFSHEALPTLARYSNREAGDLVVAQKKLAAPGRQILFDKALGEVRHVGAM